VHRSKDILERFARVDLGKLGLGADWCGSAVRQ
jgi:hypothetical protein